MPFSKKNKGCVLNCEEFIATDKGFVEVDFYDFPSDPEIRSIWIDRVRKEKKLKAWFPNRNSKLCGMHFNNSGKNILNEIIPRYFCETIYARSGITEPQIKNVAASEIENVRIKEEIDLDEEPLDEAICIVDYSNIYNTVPVTNNVPTTITFNPSNFEITKIKEENIDSEPDDTTFYGTNIFEPQAPSQITDKTILMNGHTNQKELLTNLNEDITMNDPSPGPPTLLKWDDPSFGETEKKTSTKESHTQSNECDRDLHRLTKQMKELEENLSNAHRRIAEGQISVLNLSKKVAESQKVKQQLEEENNKLRNILANPDLKRLPEKKELASMTVFQLRDEVINQETQLANVREKVKRMKEKWYRKFESFNNDEEVRYYTGFQSRSDFKKFCNMAVEMDPLFDSTSCDIFSVRKEIMITLMRLRLGLQFQDLAFRYDLYIEDVRQFTMHWQDILSESSFNRKICPSGVIIVKFFVLEFHHGFKFKYFLGVSPHGYVIYVSDLFPVTSDEKNIVQISEIQSFIEEGFTVKSLDTDRFSHLGIYHWSASPEEEAQFNIVLSKLVQEVQEYGIFKNIRPSELIRMNDVSKTWKVCCYLQNYIEF